MGIACGLPAGTKALQDRGCPGKHSSMGREQQNPPGTGSCTRLPGNNLLLSYSSKGRGALGRLEMPGRVWGLWHPISLAVETSSPCGDGRCGAVLRVCRVLYGLTAGNTALMGPAMLHVLARVHGEVVLPMPQDWGCLVLVLAGCWQEQG